MTYDYLVLEHCNLNHILSGRFTAMVNIEYRELPQ